MHCYSQVKLKTLVPFNYPLHITLTGVGRAWEELASAQPKITDHMLQMSCVGGLKSTYLVEELRFRMLKMNGLRDLRGRMRKYFYGLCACSTQWKR
jgi:hypothetical protein